MPVYIEMDPALIEEAVQPFRDAKEDDLLQRESKKDQAFLRQFSCLTCKNPELEPMFVNPGHAYGGHGLLPRHALRCTRCGWEFDPHTNLVLKTGNIYKARDAMRPPITEQDE